MFVVRFIVYRIRFCDLICARVLWSMDILVGIALLFLFRLCSRTPENWSRFDACSIDFSLLADNDIKAGTMVTPFRYCCPSTEPIPLVWNTVTLRKKILVSTVISGLFVATDIASLVLKLIAMCCRCFLNCLNGCFTEFVLFLPSDVLKARDVDHSHVV